MVKAFGVFILMLAGCTAVPPRQDTAAPCSISEPSYACQIDRYHNVAAP